MREERNRASTKIDELNKRVIKLLNCSWEKFASINGYDLVVSCRVVSPGRPSSGPSSVVTEKVVIFRLPSSFSSFFYYVYFACVFFFLLSLSHYRFVMSLWITMLAYKPTDIMISMICMCVRSPRWPWPWPFFISLILSLFVPLYLSLSAAWFGYSFG